MVRWVGVVCALVLVVVLVAATPVRAQQEPEKPPQEPPKEAPQTPPEEPPKEPPKETPAETPAEEPKKESTWDWNFNLFAGLRNPSGDWDPYETYEEAGIEASWGKKDQPVLFATDVYYSMSDENVRGPEGQDVTVTSTVWQFNPGLRRFWVLKKHWVPYFGFGVTYAEADFEKVGPNQIVTDSDASWGFWAGGGFMIRAGAHFNIGLSARFELLKAFHVSGDERNGNSSNLGLVIGWGARVEGS